MTVVAGVLLDEDVEVVVSAATELVVGAAVVVDGAASEVEGAAVVAAAADESDGDAWPCRCQNMIPSPEAEASETIAAKTSVCEKRILIWL